MSSENTEFEDGPPPDPFEAELVAYLDGEVDVVAARKVEARLANDPEARARADALKKSFDMLDYLSKPEPSPSFTTRTLDLVPAIKAATASGSAPVRPAVPRAAKPAPAPPPSTSMPVAILDEEPPRPPRRGRPLLRAAGVCVAVAVFAVVGYFATAAARPFLFHIRDKEHDEGKVEVDARVIEHLPLFAVADDISFVQELAEPKLFGDEPAVAYDTNLKIPHGDAADKSSGKHTEGLTKAFRMLPSARQAEIVKLDHDLYAKEPRERDRLFRALEVYALWLERLPDAERRGVLAAATPALRLGIIHSLREQQWMDALPPPLRQKVAALTNPKEKAELIQQWKDDEAVRRERLAFVRQHAEAFAANKSPWPFDTDAGRKEVIEFARATFRIDDNKHGRLSAEEHAEYKRTLAAAERDGTWVWYGLTVYELNRAHPYLPEPAEPKLMIAETTDLPPDAVARLVAKKVVMPARLRALGGRWPEFALEAQRELALTKINPMPQLGPARLTDFKEPVRACAKELFPKMTSDEKAALARLEGKWPEYPREFVKYAAKYDLPVPGVSLPGPPKKWDATYGARGTRPTN